MISRPCNICKPVGISLYSSLYNYLVKVLATVYNAKLTYGVSRKFDLI